MKRLLPLFLLLLALGTLQAQDDRDSLVLPKIGRRIGTIDNADGWMKNSAGQWVRRPNKIAGDYIGDNTKYIDYQKQGLGIDNFISMEITEMNYKGENYLLFTKQSKSGYYKYPQVKEGWTYRDRVFFWVFNPEDLKGLDSLKYDTLNIITLTAHTNYVYESAVNNDVTLATNVKKAMDGARCYEPTCDLYFLAKPISGKDIIRFMISNRPVGLDYGLGNGGIKTRYYETGIDNFKKLFPDLVIY